MMKRDGLVGLAVALALVASCSSSDAPPVDETPVRSALVTVEDGSEVFVIAHSDDPADLASAAAGDRTDFRWVAIRVPTSASDAVRTSGGFTADLATVTEGLRFAQNYRELCDPSSFSGDACFIVEDYAAGDAGLEGQVSVELSSGDLSMSYHVIWEGTTDRFGTPQWYRHETEGNMAAAVVE